MSTATAAPTLPLAGIRVIECTHMVMGPTCGMVLGDLGAEVIKIEPLTGDNTRKLLGAGAGFYPMFNRNKKSLAINLKDPRGLAIVMKLLATADVFSENFKTGSMDDLGLGEAALTALNPRLIYASHKGFLPGPYEHRTALDEVVQMMGGLAYMTGRPGDPLRAGLSSLSDLRMGTHWPALGAQARRKAEAGAGPSEHLKHRMRPQGGPTRRAGAICHASRCCPRLVGTAPRRHGRLVWRGNSPRREPILKSDRLHASTTSWAGCSARLACWRRCSSGTPPGAASRCRQRCSRTMYFSSRST